MDGWLDDCWMIWVVGWVMDGWVDGMRIVIRRVKQSWCVGMVIISIKIVTRVVCIFSWRVSIVKDGQDSHLDGHDGTDSYHDGQHYQKDGQIVARIVKILVRMARTDTKSG